MSSVSFPFIGRRDAIDAFHSLLSVRAQVNCLYIQAPGGLGKTQLLRAIIATCSGPRWALRPEGSKIDPLIDFSDLANRSVAGLRNSIIARLGEQSFGDFRKGELDLRDAETVLASDPSDEAAKSRVFALRRRVDDLFFSGFRQAQRGRRTALFFDTFEIAYRRGVGRWFIDQLLDASEGCLIVFAGRSPADLYGVSESKLRPELPLKVWFYELQPW